MLSANFFSITITQIKAKCYLLWQQNIIKGRATFWRVYLKEIKQLSTCFKFF
jgi:hypothetical protein